MNLHDIPDRPAATEPMRVEELIPYIQAMRREPQRLMPWQEQFLNGLGRVDWRQPPRVTFDVVTEAQHILRRLDRQYMDLQRGRVDPRHAEEIAFVLTDREWALLRAYIPWEQLRRDGFPMDEAVEPTYRGFRLVFARDRLDPLARR